MSYIQQRLPGLCPLNALEIARFLKALGAPRGAWIYSAGVMSLYLQMVETWAENAEFGSIMRELHRKSMGQPEPRGNSRNRDVIAYLVPECMCKHNTGIF
ncbi:hypothetical protein L3X38_028955 [Prunus dulcis]|uniref:Uncharacterized protein n=1 Tax=Prunus dulcis TaxID=3755 RepID=A0AAD4Z2I7_PRUDU|nr:hypothetical protein L3X38_028955 [Prunus dulcis]